MGFRSAERRHVQLVRFAMEASTSALRRVALYKRGHVEHKGPGAWEAAAARDDAWSDEEREARRPGADHGGDVLLDRPSTSHPRMSSSRDVASAQTLKSSPIGHHLKS